MNALEVPMMGPKPCSLLVGIASMVARTQTTGDIIPYMFPMWKRRRGGKEWKSQRVGSTIFHVFNSRYYRWSRSYLEATPLFYTVDISPLRGKVAGWASQPGFTRSSPSLSLSFSRPASLSSPLFYHHHLLLSSVSHPLHIIFVGICAPVGVDERVLARPDSAAPPGTSKNRACTRARKRKDAKTSGTKREVGNGQKESARFSPLRQEHPDD